MFHDPHHDVGHVHHVFHGVFQFLLYQLRLFHCLYRKARLDLVFCKLLGKSRGVFRHLLTGVIDFIVDHVHAGYGHDPHKNESCHADRQHQHKNLLLQVHLKIPEFHTVTLPKSSN